MTGAEYHAEELKRREDKKEARKEQHIKPEKLLTLNSKISEHDLNSKIAKCVKWVEKLHEIRVVISGGESDAQKNDKIVSSIAEEMTKYGGRILQKRVKNGEVRFSIMPTIKKEQNEEPPKPETGKKLLEAAPSVQIQQVRSHQTMAFLQLSYLSQHHQLQLINNGGISTKCSKCCDEKVTSKRVRITAIVAILLVAKYGFWSFIYSLLNR